MSWLLLRMSLRCSELYLSQFRLTSPHMLASGDGTKSAIVIGDVYIHPSAKVHPTAKVSNPLLLSLVEATLSQRLSVLCINKQIGPNVSISANARVGPGVRLISCIILDDVEIMVCLLTHQWLNFSWGWLFSDCLHRKMQWWQMLSSVGNLQSGDGPVSRHVSLLSLSCLCLVCALQSWTWGFYFVDYTGWGSLQFQTWSYNSRYSSFHYRQTAKSTYRQKANLKYNGFQETRLQLKTRLWWPAVLFFQIRLSTLVFKTR